MATAAHCVEIGNPNSFTVVAGEYSLVNDDGTEQQASASNILIHESYDPWTLANDIALIRLKYPLNLTQAVQPIPLPAGGIQLNGEILKATLEFSSYTAFSKFSSVIIRYCDGIRLGRPGPRRREKII